MALLILSGCAVTIENQRWYGDEGADGAVWFETLTTATGHIDKPTWDQMRVGMACTTTDTFATIKAEIEKLCSVTKCRYSDVEEALGKFEANLNELAKFRDRGNQTN